MRFANGASPSVGALASQFVVPEQWAVIPGARLTGGWLGTIETSLAVLAPGPARDSVHLAQLVVFVLETDRAEARQRLAVRVQLAAAADIPEAWLVDHFNGWTEVYRAPFDGKYRSRSLCYPGEALHPLALPRAPIAPISGVGARPAR